MNWISKEKSKYWNKAYQEYSLESGEVDFFESQH